MAKSTSKPRKIRQFPNPTPAELPENGTETAVIEAEAEPSTPFDEQAPAEAAEPPARPKTGRNAPQGAKTLTFFERLQTISRKEWEGDRAKIKLYRLAPLINRLMSSEHKFVSVYNEPVTEERIKVDHGSGKYRLYLNYKAAEQNEREIDRVELDILDQNFPPKIPPGEWMDDHRNKQWAWAKPAGAPGFNSNGIQPGTPAAPVDPLAAFGTFMDIQDRIESRTQPAAQPAPTPANDLLTQLKLIKELSQPATPAAPAKDPLELAISLMTIMNQQRAENPIVDMMRAELQAVREELKEARKTPPAAQKSFIEQLMEYSQDDKMEKIKKVFNIFNGGGDGPSRPEKVSPLGLAREFISSPMGASIGNGVAVLLSQMMQPKTNGGPPTQYPTVLNQQNPNGTAPPVELGEQRIQRIGAQITRPMIAHFMRGGEGQDFAQSMYDMGAEDYVFMRGLGADDIIRRYRAFPEAWNYVQGEAARFEEYIRAFCTWDPNADEGPTPGDNGDDGVVDLEAQP